MARGVTPKQKLRTIKIFFSVYFGPRILHTVLHKENLCSQHAVPHVISDNKRPKNFLRAETIRNFLNDCTRIIDI